MSRRRLLPETWLAGQLVSYRAAPGLYIPSVVLRDAGEPAPTLTVHVHGQGEMQTARMDVTPRCAPIVHPLQVGDEVQGRLMDPHGLPLFEGDWTVTRVGLSVTLANPHVPGERVVNPDYLVVCRRADLALALAELPAAAERRAGTRSRKRVTARPDFGPLFGGAR
ncbi:hypothetical protein IHN63_03280 [Deinococcus sp. 6YEL10]|uniref:hypothetical protein n=1 Tax=Deinococcus sp. 6YEL10 TaxID=2745870 RepID=UPI001E2C8144|nr:hypothetical protein [Deinococcus sp. 6YEL10]MCD0160323.1 hypothetical protein [Deinococcus sp. 6YEL10]